MQCFTGDINVIREMGEQVASRLRSKGKQAGVVSLYVGFAYSSIDENGNSGFHAQMSIDSTNNSGAIVKALHYIFDTHYHGQVVRNLGVSVGKLKNEGQEQLDLLSDPIRQIKDRKLDETVDKIRNKYGVTSIVKLSSLGEGGTMINRVGLVGGHNGGNSYG